MTDDPDAGLKGELSAVMPGSQPLTNLKVTHMGGATYRVLSARNGQPTLYKVDLGEVECTCPDHEYNREDQTVCAHLVKAALSHPDQLGVETQAAWTLMNQGETLHSLTEKVRDTARQAEQSLVTVRDLQAGTEAADDAGGTADPDPDPSSPEPDVDPVEAVREWLDSQYVAPEKVDVSEGPHGGTPGVRLEPDNRAMSDAQYESFKSVLGSVDDSTVHVGFTDEGCNFCSSGDDGFWYHIPQSAAGGL